MKMAMSGCGALERVPTQAPYGVLSTGTPVMVPGLDNVISVATGEWFALAATRDGNVYTWDGINAAPTKIPGISEVKKVVCKQDNYSSYKHGAP